MMTDALIGRPLSEANEMVASVQAMFNNETELEHESLTELSALEGVRNYPSRVKCALLAWTTAQAALNNSKDQVTTEK